MSHEITTDKLVNVIIPFIVIVMNLLWAFPFMWCWNFVMPYLFHLPTLTWGQSWCLLLIANSILPNKIIQKS